MDVEMILSRVATGMATAEDAAVLRSLLAPFETRPCAQLTAARCPVMARYVATLAGPCSQQGGCACPADKEVH